MADPVCKHLFPLRDLKSFLTSFPHWYFKSNLIIHFDSLVIHLDIKSLGGSYKHFYFLIWYLI